MKVLYSAFVLALISIAVYSQSIEYGYDACGNRITRQIVLQQSNKSLFVAEQQDVFSEEVLSNSLVRIYPNPTHGLLKVTIQSPDELKGSIEVFNSQGVRIAYIANVEQENDIDLSAHHNGIYLMRLKVGAASSTWKILKK
ncbi:MAG: T9SS type A sorting domain-containing protein [Bacteroidales bacterium]|nr:T9SS type A sorting domain-containing protein [Bacteroidales bacterium]